MNLEVIQGDLTVLDVDAIVNAANHALLGGGGVDGAIHRAAGPELLAECRALREVSPGVRCPTGQARMTGGYRLEARRVIHTVGPVWQGGGQGEPEQLASCYRESLRLARDRGLRSVAFPAISCGVYGYPIEQAAIVAIDTIRQWMTENSLPDRVILCAFNESTATLYRNRLAHWKEKVG